jgi:hypothetical protein
VPWSSAGLPLINEPSDDMWPLGFAVDFMQIGPVGLTTRRLRDALRAEGIRPVGRMKWAGPRPVPVYPVAELIRVAETLSEARAVLDRNQMSVAPPSLPA